MKPRPYALACRSILRESPARSNGGNTVFTDPVPARSTRVTVVESEACHFCEDAHRVLDDLAVHYPLTVEFIEVRSAEGQRLMARHRAALSPLVLLDDAFFSHGRLPRRKLHKTLVGLYGDPAVRSAQKAG